MIIPTKYSNKQCSKLTLTVGRGNSLYTPDLQRLKVGDLAHQGRHAPMGTDHLLLASLRRL
jgi:hypothetical protein